MAEGHEESDCGRRACSILIGVGSGLLGPIFSFFLSLQIVHFGALAEHMILDNNTKQPVQWTYFRLLITCPTDGHWSAVIKCLNSNIIQRTTAQEQKAITS